MKLNNKTNLKIKQKPSIKATLMLCFLAFSTIMIILLWVFQTVFLDGFYKSIKISQAKNISNKIVSIIKNYDSDADFEDLSNTFSKQSDMSVLIYNTSSGVYSKVYSSEEGGVAYFGSNSIKDHEAYQYYRKAKENGGKYLDIRDIGASKNILSQNDRIFYQDYADDSTNGYADNRRYSTSFLFDNKVEKREMEYVVYAQIVNRGVAGNETDTDTYLVVVESAVTPVTSTIQTLRYQLTIITIIMLIFSIGLASILAIVITKPILAVNRNAKELSKQNYDVKFSGGAYREIQELNTTLNFATSELSKVDSLRKELIANVSHDLRTPLTMIIGYGEVMRDLPNENTPENVQIIIDEATRLSILVSDLMDISKLQSGTLTVDKSRFSLTDCIRSIFDRYSKLIEQDNYIIEFECDADVTVFADHSKISQVIYNLINNAINYAGADKTVIVRQKVEDNMVLIEVEDHGVGIEADKIDLIWDRYYKVDKSHKSSVIGTGLGLSIVKTILQLHNATFGVKSEVGHGSTFWFKLPLE